MNDQARENIKVVKNLYKFLSLHELNALRDNLDSEVEWIEPAIQGLWFGGTRRGMEAVLKEVLEPAFDKIERFHAKMKKFYAVGDHVIAIGSMRGRGKLTQEPLAADTVHVWTFRNGKVIRFEGFHDPEEWRKTLGLSGAEPQALAA